MKMRKNVLVFAAATVLSLAMGSTSFAGQWQRNDIGWWWQEDNGSWPASEWQWIDGNKDGIAECYYFDGDGYLLVNTVTPDGYTVNADGAWTLNGQVQKQESTIANNQQNTINDVATSNVEEKGGWKVGEYQDEGLEWYYYDENGNMLKDTWTPDGNYVSGDGLWLPNIPYNGESTDAYVNKVAAEIADYYAQTQKWYFDFYMHKTYASMEEANEFLRKLANKLDEVVPVNFVYVNSYSVYKVDGGYLMKSAWTELTN